MFSSHSSEDIATVRPSPHSFWLLVRSVLYALLKLTLIVLEVWWSKLYTRLTRKCPKQLLEERMATANSYWEWYAAGLELDAMLGNDLWRQNPISRYYDYTLISARLSSLIASYNLPVQSRIATFRSGLLRNLGNITSTQLFSRSHVGTKILIETYTDAVVEMITHIASLPPSAEFSHQQKFSFISDTRQVFGRTALMLQGGATFGLCHLGVVRALHHQALLPRIITGTGVGALIAALVGIHTDPELPHFLSGDGIDLTAFPTSSGSWKRKLLRFWRTRYLLDVKVLESCVRANVGDLTFLEAYTRTKRILCITVSTSDPHNPIPTLLNYLTAPNVLIWSAACASNAPSPLFEKVQLLCKNEHDIIVPWVSDEVQWRKWSEHQPLDRDSPYTRLAEQFNVNHFLVSQARPYLVPFLSSDLHRHHRRGVYLKLLKLIGMEIKHILRQMDTLGLLPRRVRSFLIGEIVPGDSITIVPKLVLGDFEQLLSNPRKDTVDYWIMKGERGVWGAVEIIKTSLRCEMQLDALYWRVKEAEPAEGRRKRRIERERRPSE
ncbi:acyl transferase/acyl hydrolase/lysophospholipase [Trichophaea hybrida]|nr:acyl transferase/acyl hydrolase/lysophospholipase [Trichophaea hybrida]